MELSGPGVQFIVDNQLVRRCAVNNIIDYFLYIISATELGKDERFLLNIASPPTSLKLIREGKGNIRINLNILKYFQAALSMVKAILLEVYLIGAFLSGLVLLGMGLEKHELELDNWILAKGHFYQGVIFTHNSGKGLPVDNSSLRNFGIAYSFRWLFRQRRDYSTLNCHRSYERLEEMATY
jgi:hypothetical protein